MGGKIDLEDCLLSFYWAEKTSNPGKVRCCFCHGSTNPVSATRDSCLTHQQSTTHMARAQQFVVQVRPAPDGEEDPNLGSDDEKGIGFCRFHPRTGCCVVDKRRMALSPSLIRGDDVEVLYYSSTGM